MSSGWVPKHIEEAVKTISEALGVSELHLVDIQRNSWYTKYVYRLPDEEAKKMFKPVRLGALTLEIVLEESRNAVTGAYALLKLNGDTTLGSEYVELKCPDADCIGMEVSRVVKGRYTEERLKLFDDAVAMLIENNCEITSVSASRDANSSFVVTAIDRSHDINITVLVDVNKVDVGFSVHSSYEDYLLRDDVYDALSKYMGSRISDVRFIDFDDDADEIYVLVSNVQLNEVPSLAETVQDAVMEAVDKKVELAEKIEPVEAAALYIIGHASEWMIYDVLARTSGITEGIVWDRARVYFAEAVNLARPPNTLYKCIAVLHNKGRLTVDGEGYLVLDGRRVIDMVVKYTDGETVYQDGDHVYSIEDDEIDALSELFKVSESELRRFIDGDKAIPGRVVKAVLHDADLRQKHLEMLIGSPVAWNKLSSGAKMILAEQDHVDVLSIARERGWSWVLEDRYFLAMLAVTRCRDDVNCVTKTLAEHMPDLVGGDFDVVYARGSPFIRVRNVVLQVRKVLSDFVEVQGTVGTSSVGIVARGRTVADAARRIAENLVDAVMEFKELASDVAEGKVKAEVKYWETPLFKVPYLAVQEGGRKLVVPAQPNIRKVAENALIHRTRQDEDEDVIASYS